MLAGAVLSIFWAVSPGRGRPGGGTPPSGKAGRYHSVQAVALSLRLTGNSVAGCDSDCRTRQPVSHPSLATVPVPVTRTLAADLDTDYLTQLCRCYCRQPARGKPAKPCDPPSSRLWTPTIRSASARRDGDSTVSVRLSDSLNISEPACALGSVPPGPHPRARPPI